MDLLPLNPTYIESLFQTHVKYVGVGFAQPNRLCYERKEFQGCEATRGRGDLALTRCLESVCILGRLGRGKLDQRGLGKEYAIFPQILVYLYLLYGGGLENQFLR